MRNGLNEFLLDNSMSTQGKYDLFAEKMNTAQRSYNIRSHSSTSDAVMLVGGLLKIIFGLLMLIVGLVVMIFNSINRQT